ncbi:hypothetical protein ACQKNX_06110 [Lysinibacillus sp. NPDC093712]|uniref:hypothetical protein n=1 Tax=Lysinibacillus sp. NPDC093712 TaxID=3390579 RepID=UPI003D00776C
MSRTVTSAVNTKYEEKIQETFTFAQLGIDEKMNNEETKMDIDKIFESWVYARLNISYSIVFNMASE